MLPTAVFSTGCSLFGLLRALNGNGLVAVIGATGAAGFVRELELIALGAGDKLRGLDREVRPSFPGM